MTATRSALARRRDVPTHGDQCPRRRLPPDDRVAVESSASCPRPPTAPSRPPAHRLDRRDADDRHVEPHVLLRLRDLDDADAGAGEMAGAGDHFVGAFHRLDGHDRLVLHRDRLADVERRRSRRPCGSRTRSPSAPPRSARARSARRRSASSGVRNAVESISSMPWSRSTSATAPMMPSVFLRRQLRQHREQRHVRDDAAENIFVCFTWPAITACVTPASLQQLDARARAGRARSSGSSLRGRAAASFEFGKRLFLGGDDGDVVARARAARARGMGTGRCRRSDLGASAS